MKKYLALLALPVLLAACGGAAEHADDTVTELTTPDMAVEDMMDEVVAEPAGASITSHSDAQVVTSAPVVIRGEVPVGTQSVTVNGFTLTRFVAGDTSFTYIAQPSFQNLQVGENTYEVLTTQEDGMQATTMLSINYQPAQ